MFYLQVSVLLVMVFLIPMNVTMGHVFWTWTNVMEVRTVQMAVMRGQKLVVSIYTSSSMQYAEYVVNSLMTKSLLKVCAPFTESIMDTGIMYSVEPA